MVLVKEERLNRTDRRDRSDRSDSSDLLGPFRVDKFGQIEYVGNVEKQERLSRRERREERKRLERKNILYDLLVEARKSRMQNLGKYICETLDLRDYNFETHRDTSADTLLVFPKRKDGKLEAITHSVIKFYNELGFKASPITIGQAEDCSTSDQEKYYKNMSFAVRLYDEAIPITVQQGDEYSIQVKKRLSGEVKSEEYKSYFPIKK